METIKRFLKVYPLPIFIVLLTFIIYYFAFETLLENKKGSENKEKPQTEIDSMATLDSNQTSPTPSIPPVAVEAEPPTPLEPPQEEQYFTQVFSTTPSLNIREKPSTQAGIVGKFTQNDTAILLEEQNGWILLGNIDNQAPMGWVLKTYTRTEENKKIASSTAPSASLLPSKEIILITASVPSLNIRENSSTTSQVLGKLTPNLTAYILEDNGDGWILIGDSINKKPLGWVLKQLTSVIRTETQTLTEQTPQTNTNTSQPTLPTEPEPVIQSQAPQNTDNILQNTTNATQDASAPQIPPLSAPQEETLEATPNLQNNNTQGIYTSRVERLNIRSNPSTEAEIVGKLTPADRVEIVQTKEQWVQIRDTQTPSVKNGWVVRRSLKEP